MEYNFLDGKPYLRVYILPSFRLTDTASGMASDCLCYFWGNLGNFINVSISTKVQKPTMPVNRFVAGLCFYHFHNIYMGYG